MADTDAPELDAQLVRYGPTENSARIFIDLEDLVIWLSLIHDWVPTPEDKRSVAMIRDTMASTVAEGRRANWVAG